MFLSLENYLKRIKIRELMEGESERVLEDRKEKLLKGFKLNKKYKNWLIYVVLVVIAYIGYFIRTRNLDFLIDASTGKNIPLALDPFAFLRYVKYILANGSLMSVDLMRYYPFGYDSVSEVSFLSHFIVWMYKFISFFAPAITVEKVLVLYPPICFVIGLVFCFLFVREIFNWKIGLLSVGFLAVLPAYLYRTMAGFADKESAAMMFMFFALYMFALYLKNKKLNSKLIFAGLSGLSVGFMGLIWGGVNFIFLSVGAFILISVLMNKFDEKEFYGYILFLVVCFLTLMIGYPSKYGFMNLIGSDTSGVLVLAFGVALINYLVFQKDLFKLKSKLEGKLPKGIWSLIIVLIIAVIFGSLFLGWNLWERLLGLWDALVNKPGSRWILTVAESHQPYFKDIIGQFNWKFFVLFFAGATFLFYEIVKNVKQKFHLTLGFLAFIILFSFSRYKPDSVLNGDTSLSLVLYGGSLVAFGLGLLIYYLWAFFKNKEVFRKFHNFDKSLIFVLLLFFFLLIGARTAVRLLFVFAPITAILGAYAVFYIIDKAKLFKDKVYQYAVVIAVVALAVLLLFSFYNSTMSQAKYTGPSYNQQWQYGMSWVRDNIDVDAVFAHWWDYGYWVQTGGERATLSDGGNALGALNHYIGRHLLTADNETEALEYLKAREATHVLMISDEIGKYGAYSSIGADENYDRYSWIPSFGLDRNQVQETRNGTVLVYTGGSVLDSDLIYQDMVFPQGSAGIGGFVIPVTNDENGTIVSVEQPTAAIAYQGQLVNVPLRCVYMNGEELIFDGEEEYLEACLMLIPRIDSSYDPIGSSLYLSPKVWNQLFAQLYLMEKEEDFPNFNLVYTDQDSMPLSMYNGMMIGPMKIWGLSYPSYLNVPEEYYSTGVVNTAVLEV